MTLDLTNSLHTIGLHHRCMYIHATGFLVKKLKRPQAVSGQIFLYQGVLIPGSKEEAMKVPVVQML